LKVPSKFVEKDFECHCLKSRSSFSYEICSSAQKWIKILHAKSSINLFEDKDKVMFELMLSKATLDKTP